jgi:hypothetical protein
MNDRHHQQSETTLSPVLTPVGLPGSTAWVGAISFEDRCVSSLDALRREGARVSNVFALDYGKVSHLLGNGRQSRRERQMDMEYSSKRLMANWNLVPVDAYGYSSIKSAMKNVLERIGPSSPLIVDITCMTKIHVMAIASLAPSAPNDIIIAYTSPDNYAPQGREHAQWRDIIIAPIAGSASLFNETFSRGIIITGLDAGRLVVSLSEIEPSGGIVIYPHTPERPDFLSSNRSLNKRIVSQLTVNQRSRSWSTAQMRLNDFESLKGRIQSEIVLARRQNAPVILFPCGPKALVFAVAVTLAEEYGDGSWFVYPIPSFYDPGYTEGAASTLWTKLIRSLVQRDVPE